MSDSKHEGISVLMDGDLPPSQARELIDQTLNDSELRGTWLRYHLIGDALRGTLAPWHDREFPDGVRERLAAEPVVLAPVRWRRRVARPLAAVAIAASVAAVAVLGVQRLERGAPGAPEAPAVAEREARPDEMPTMIEFQPAPVSMARWEQASPAAASRLKGYLVNYSERRANLGMPGMPPYVRIVGYEAEQ